jgi:tetratricopeptide (TPR) repeat protein
VALENFGHADPSSLDLLRFLYPQLPPQPLWILLAGVPLTESGPEVRRFVERLEGGPAVDRWVLRPLNPPEVLEFVRSIDPAKHPTPHELTVWFSESRGNPLFLEQILRTRSRPSPTLPEAARAANVPFSEFARARISELTEAERKVLALASVLGLEFPFSLLRAASDFEEERLAEIVERLVERGMLREGPEEAIEFPRDELRTLVFGDLPRERQRELHQRVARALLSSRRSDPDALFALAHHAFEGGLDAEAVEANRRAAEFAAQVASPEIARTHLERALKCLKTARPDDLAGELELRLALAMALDQLGELKRAELTVREALELPRPAGENGGTAAGLLPIYLARILSEEGQWSEADALTERLLKADREGENPVSRIALLRLRGGVDFYHGHYADALRHHERALEIARRAGEGREVALATVRRANALSMIPGRSEEAFTAYREACESLLKLGGVSEAAVAHISLGITLFQNDRSAEALEELSSGLALAEEASDVRQQGWARFNIADVLREQGELPEARQQNARAQELLARIGDRFGVAQTQIISAKIALKVGGFSEAERELERAQEIVRELGVEPDEVEVLLRLAEVALGQQDTAKAVERWRELVRHGGADLRLDLAPEILHLREGLRALGVAVDGESPK